MKPNLQHIMNEVMRFLGDAFSFDDLISFVEYYRGNPLRFEECSMQGLFQPTASAFIIPLRDCDLICTRFGLDTNRKEQVKLHEIAHILSGDIDLCKGDAKVPSCDEFLFNEGVRDEYIHSLHFRDGNIDAAVSHVLHEQDIEMLSVLLMESIERFRAAAPPTAKLLYGYKG